MTKEQPTAKPLAPERNILRIGKRDVGQNFVLVIHGGAGTMNREGSTPEKCTKYKAMLIRALKVCYKVLKLGAEAMDATVAAVTVLEDSPLFNTGKGAVFNIAGKVRCRFLIQRNILRLLTYGLPGRPRTELEASLVPSKPPAVRPAMATARRSISVTLLTCIKNPSPLVLALYLAPSLAPHPILSGGTAETIGADHFYIQIVSLLDRSKVQGI